MLTGIIPTLLLTSMIVFAIKISPARASDTIYIRADGSIDPPTAPIQRSVDLYTLTDDIASSADGITVERNNIVLDGVGHVIMGTGKGVYVRGRSNVTVENVRLTSFGIGICLNASNNNRIIGNTITSSTTGLWLGASDYNNISANHISHSSYGVLFRYDPLSNIIADNCFKQNGYGIYLYEASSGMNIITGNTVCQNNEGIFLAVASGNFIYYNKVLSNNRQVFICGRDDVNAWDNGYPSGGNYWSDYSCNDERRGLLQNETGSDGIADTPYVVDMWEHRDNYPLVFHNAGIVDIDVSPAKQVLHEGSIVHVYVEVAEGPFAENVTIALCANSTSVSSKTIFLLSGEREVVTFGWNTSGLVYGNYNLQAVAGNVSFEIDISDNTFDLGQVTLTGMGDVDGNFGVDILDVVRITCIYGYQWNHFLFNPNADLNDDGIIYISDVVLCTSHYGEKYP